MIAAARIGGLLLAAMLLLAGCGGKPVIVGDSDRDSAPPGRVDVAMIPDAVPRHEPRSRYGNPESYEVFGKRYHTLRSSEGHVERGIASWYGTKFHGRRTSSGEPYDMYAMTAAHTALPLPTYVRVTNLENGHSIVVRVNDRGPFAKNRIIDLSYAAAIKLGMTEKGTALVEVRALEPGRPEPAPEPTPVHAEAAPGPTVFIQMGAFSSRQNAEQMLARLTAFALPAAVNINEARIGDRPVFRVRLGPLASVDLADDTVRELERAGFREYRIVVD